MKWQMKTKISCQLGFSVMVIAMLCSCATNERPKTNINDTQEIKLAMAYIDKGDYDAAYNVLIKAQERDQNNFFAVYNLGVVYHSWGKFTEARSNYQKALAILERSEFEATAVLRYRRIIESNMAVLGYNN
jgi:Tfp pilus assembly protein PilF